MAIQHGLPTWSTVALGLAGTILAMALLAAVYILIRRSYRWRMNNKGYSEAEFEDVLDFTIPLASTAAYTCTAITGSSPEIVQPADTNERLDPSIYMSDDELECSSSPFSGPSRLCFSLHYEQPYEKLTVRLIRATRLPSKGNGFTTTPYVKLCLLPNKKRKIQSRICHKSTNPEFNEDFIFIVQEEELHTRTLKFTVCDFDRFSRQQVIGYVMYPLADADAAVLYEDAEIWREIEGGNITKPPITPKGKLLFCLQFLPMASRLTIIIMKAIDLHLDCEQGNLHPYVKVSMVLGGKTCKKKNTTIAKRTHNPVFNEAFTFTIPPACLSRVSFIMSVINAPRLGGTKKLIGRCVVGPYMCSTGPGLAHWNDMLDSVRSPIAQWHSLF